MLNRLQPLEKEQLANLHNACMRILSKVGVVFHDAEALEIFKKHGFKVDGNKVCGLQIDLNIIRLNSNF